MWHGDLNICFAWNYQIYLCQSIYKSLKYLMIILRQVFHYTKNPGEILEKCNSVCHLNLQSSLGCKNNVCEAIHQWGKKHEKLGIKLCGIKNKGFNREEK